MSLRKFVFVVEEDVAGFMVMDDSNERNAPLVKALVSGEFDVVIVSDESQIEIGDTYSLEEEN
jgi:hypothetical protein